MIQADDVIQRAHHAALLKIGQERLDGVGPNVDSYAAQEGVNEALHVVLEHLRADIEALLEELHETSYFDPSNANADPSKADLGRGWPAIHARIGNLRGMCTDEESHVEIDKALAVLDDLLYAMTHPAARHHEAGVKPDPGVSASPTGRSMSHPAEVVSDE